MNFLWSHNTAVLYPRLHDTTACQTELYNRFDNRVERTATVRSTQFRFDNRVERTAVPSTDCQTLVVQPVWQPTVHDTRIHGCQTGLITGLTTSCIVYTNIYPVVKLVWWSVWQQVVLCKWGFSLCIDVSVHNKCLLCDIVLIFKNCR